MPTTCQIDFENNPDKVAYSGQLLRGTITLTFSRRETVSGIFLETTGRAHAHWKFDSGIKRHRSYTGYENYLYEKTYLKIGK